ncbi:MULTISPECIES: hypothetical protein [Asaia]
MISNPRVVAGSILYAKSPPVSDGNQNRKSRRLQTRPTSVPPHL